jgi:methanogenic corrinoid protein MtbC1/DNA-binding XRE family transcriptional regulator
VTSKTRLPSSRALATMRRDYEAVLFSGNPDQAQQITTRMIASGWPVAVIYVEVFSKALATVGQLWHDDKISIAHEHRATQITLEQTQIVRRSMVVAADANRRAVVTAIANNDHIVGARMAADLLMEDGWMVDFLGGDTPASGLVELIEETNAKLVCLSVALPDHVDAARQTIDVVKASASSPIVIIGGGAITGGYGDDLTADARIASLYDVATTVRRLFESSANPESMESFLEHTGSRIRELRRLRGISQQALASAADMDRGYLSSVEQGKQNVTLGALMKVAQGLGVSLSDLLAPD